MCPRVPPRLLPTRPLLEAGGPLPLAVKAFSGGDGTGPDPPPPPTEAARKLLVQEASSNILEKSRVFHKISNIIEDQMAGGTVGEQVGIGFALHSLFFATFNMLEPDVETDTNPDVGIVPRGQVGNGWRCRYCFLLPFNLLKPDESFRAVSERLLVSPVVKTLVFNNAKDEARQWADEVAEDWNFRRIIPCHFAGPVLDLRALNAIETFLKKAGVLYT
eukprot:jgi/Botrbrau1/14345/Bobra.0014s0002.1